MKLVTQRLCTIIACLAFAATSLFAQQTKTVSGTILDELGQGAIGASVKVEGTQLGQMADMDGKFTIKNVPASAKYVIVSYMGYETQKVKITPNIRVQLTPSAKEMTTVVVDGMRSMDKRMFTGASTQVKAEDVKLDGIPDVSRALEGRVAGVTVQNVSGTFGTAPKIRVRGASSIYGTGKPLWVIDGVIQEDAVEISADDLSSGDATTLISNAIAGLNADDIESFQVLKDGSATSIYGARAMAGVVVITTKRGKAGVSSINYTGEFSTRLKPSYSDYNICNSQEQVGIYKEMEQKGWLEFSNLVNGSTAGLYGAMYTQMAKYDEATGTYGLPFTDAAMGKYLQTAEYRNTDWFDQLFNTNISQNHSVSISTGSDKASLYASLSMMNDPGWTKQSEVKRYTANMNAQFKVSKWVTIQLLSAGSYIDQNAPGTLARTTDVVSGQVSRSFDINPFSYCLNTSRTLDPSATYTRNYAKFSIFDELNNNYIKNTQMDLKFQGQLTWKPLRELELNALISYRTLQTNQQHFILNNSNQANAYRAGEGNPNIQYSNTYLYTDPDEPNSLPISVMPEGGIYIRTDNNVSQLDFRATGEWKHFSPNEDHFIDVFFGMESGKVDRDYIYNSEYGVDYDNARAVINTPKFFKQAKEEGTELASFSKSWSRNMAYFISGTYSWKSRYTLNLTGRYEGSNRLGRATSSRWLPTWNVSGAWNMHEEEFFKRMQATTNNAFSHFTLRASYSLTADPGYTSISNALAVFQSNQAWRPQGDQMETVIALTNLANSDLTYEKKNELNVGFDAGFFNNRLNFVFDIWWRNNYDLIGYVQTQGVGGEIGKWGNVANLKSNGVELTISSVNIKNKNFTWNTDLTFSYAKDEITDLKSRSNVIGLITGNSSNHYRVGYATSALFSIPFVGLSDEGIPQIINEKGEVTSTDINFQEYENLDFLKYEGPTEPTITGGFNNTFKYKNWRFNLFLTYAFGNVVRLDPVFSAGYSDMSAMSKEFKNRWVQPGDEEYTDIPVILSRRQYYDNSMLSYAYNAYNYSTARVAKGDFIRLKDVSIAYDLPKTFLNKIGLNSASIKLDATNLCLLYSDKKLNGQDPEFVNSGGVATPMPKQFTLTLRLGL